MYIVLKINWNKIKRHIKCIPTSESAQTWNIPVTLTRDMYVFLIYTDIPAAKLLLPRKLVFKVIVFIPWFITNPLHILPKELHFFIPYASTCLPSMAKVQDVICVSRCKISLRSLMINFLFHQRVTDHLGRRMDLGDTTCWIFSFFAFSFYMSVYPC